MIAYDRFEARDHFIDVAVGGVDDERIIRRAEGRDLAIRVTIVPCGLFSEELCERDMGPLSSQFLLTPAGPDLSLGDEEELALGMREGDSPLIATFADDVMVVGNAALRFNERAPDLRVLGDERSGLCRFSRAKVCGDIPAVRECASLTKGDLE